MYKGIYLTLQYIYYKMAKKKNFRQVKPAPKKKSRSDMEHCYLVSRKILHHFELDPKLLDVFTKKQKERLGKIYYITPTIDP